MEHCIFLAFNEATTIITTFDIWMSEGGFGTFEITLTITNPLLHYYRVL
jgi:hypothetical protein